MEDRRPTTTTSSGSGGHTQVLLYSRSLGTGSIFRANAEGQAFDLVRTHENWSKSWDLIVPGKFGGTTGQDDLLFYSRNGIGSFYQVSMDGSIQPIHSHANWAKTWWCIVPVKESLFKGQREEDGLDRLLFYDKTNCVGYFFRVKKEPKGTLEPIAEPQRGWAQWENIVALDVGLLFYRYPGQCCLYSIVDGKGTLQFMKKYDFGNYEWNCIVPGIFTPRARERREGEPRTSDVLLYERKSGNAAMYSFNERGEIVKAIFEQRAWAKGWSYILAGTHQPDRGARTDDLFCFDCSISKGASFADNGAAVLARLTCENKIWTNIVAMRSHRGVDTPTITARKLEPTNTILIDLDLAPAEKMDVDHEQLIEMNKRIHTLVEANEQLVESNRALKKENEELSQILHRIQGNRLDGLTAEELTKLEEELFIAMRKVSAKKAEVDIKEKEAEKKLCVVCMDREKNIVFVECSHLCCCQQCSDMLKTCPMCRAAVVTKLRVYDSHG